MGPTGSQGRPILQGLSGQREVGGAHPALQAIRSDIDSLEQVVVTRLTDYMKPPLSWLAPLKFRRDAKNEGRRWPPVGPNEEVVWWAELVKPSHPLPPTVKVDARRHVASLVYTGGTTGLS